MARLRTAKSTGRLAQVMANNKSRNTVMVQDPAIGGRKTAAVLVYSTFPGPDAALAAGRSLVEAGLAACVNVLPGMTSVYAWEGKIETASEAVLIAKTTAECLEACMSTILAAHPYETPAVVALPVIGGSAAYLEWIGNNTNAISKTTTAGG